MIEQGHDVLYYENIEGGHGGAADNAQRADVQALQFAFLWQQLAPLTRPARALARRRPVTSGAPDDRRRHPQRSPQRFEATVDGQLCVADYQLRGDVMWMTHTGVPSAVGGRGIAAELVRVALEWAEEQGLHGRAVVQLRRGLHAAASGDAEAAGALDGDPRGLARRCLVHPPRIALRQHRAHHQLHLVEQHQRQHDGADRMRGRTAPWPSGCRWPGSSWSRRTRW